MSQFADANARQIKSRATSLRRESRKSLIPTKGWAEILGITVTSKWLSEGSSLFGYRVAETMSLDQ
jgi:hypothetical protein